MKNRYLHYIAYLNEALKTPDKNIPANPGILPGAIFETYKGSN